VTNDFTIPTGFATAFAPSGRRGRWLVTVLCSRCKSAHARLVQNPADVEGLMQAGCGGGPLNVVIVRVYGAAVAA
jgi:hypothetical protein